MSLWYRGSKQVGWGAEVAVEGLGSDEGNRYERDEMG